VAFVPHARESRTHPDTDVRVAQLAPNGTQGGDLYTVRADGQDLEQVLLGTHVYDHFASGRSWSPDGARLVFSMWTELAHSTDLYTISPDGTNLVQITHEDGAEAWARWGRAAAG